MIKLIISDKIFEVIALLVILISLMIKSFCILKKRTWAKIYNYCPDTDLNEICIEVWERF